jgi:radical SAM protein with 4Fe4S-binding SPASM domain
MHFKTVYLDVVKKTPNELKNHAFRDDFFMNLDNVQNVLTQVRVNCDHISFSLFNDVNDHPQVKEIFELCRQLGYRFNITVQSDAFVNHIDAYTNNNAISFVNIPLSYLQENDCLTQEKRRYDLFYAINQLKDSKINVQIDLFSKKVDDYDEHTLAFLDLFDVQIHDNLWDKGFQMDLEPNLFIRCCEQKDDTGDLPPKTLGRCYGSVTMLGIMGDGNVIPCNHIKGQAVVLGNIFEKPLNDILNNEPYLSIHDGFYKNQLSHPVCQRCPHPRKVF